MAVATRPQQTDDQMEVEMPASQAPIPPDDDQMTPAQVKAEYGVKDDTQAGWRRRGLVSWWKRGGRRGWVIYSRREMQAFMAQQRTLRPGRVLPSYESPETDE